MSQALRDAAWELLNYLNEQYYGVRVRDLAQGLERAINDLEQAPTHTMSASREDMERARFEKDVCAANGRHVDRYKDTGEYIDEITEELWCCWMAALKGQK